MQGTSEASAEAYSRYVAQANERVTPQHGLEPSFGEAV